MTMLADKKIIFVLGNLELGGAERQALLLASYLHEQMGAKVMVLGLGPPNRVSELCGNMNLAWQSAPFGFSGNLLRDTVQLTHFTLLLRRLSPDILMPYTWFPNVLCGVVWRATGASCCIWNQRDSGYFLDSRRIAHFLAAKFTPFFLSNSRHGATFLVDNFKLKRNSLAIIPNGVRLEAPRDDRIAWRHRLGVDENDFVGCMVANFSLTKDHATGVRAWRLVVDQLATGCRRAMLVLAGRDDGTVNSINELIRELHLDRNVCILDSVDDVTGLLLSSDLGVHCSEHEGCPNAVLEEMAAGLPVVATDNEGVRMVLGEGAETFIASHQDVEGIAKRILQFALDSELGTRVGRNNKQRISDCYSVETMCRETVRFIDHALKHTV